MMSANKNVITLPSARRPGDFHRETEIRACANRAAAGQRLPGEYRPLAQDDGVVALTVQFQRMMDPLLVVTALAVCIRFYQVPFDGTYVALAAIAALLTLMLFKPLALAQPWHHRGLLGLCISVVGSWMMVAGLLLLFGAVTGYIELYPFDLILRWFIAVPALIIAQHWLLRTGLWHYLHSRRRRRTAAVVGVNELSLSLVDRMTALAHLGLSFKGFFDDRNATRIDSRAHSRLLGQLNDLSVFTARHKIDVIYIALPMSQHERILKLLDGLRDTTASIYFVPDIFVFDLIQGRVDDFDGLPVLAVCETPFTGIHRITKRLTDVAVASVALVTLAPLLALIALGVKLSSAGPVLFKQRRYGVDGREIVIYKFRTMFVCEDGNIVLQAHRQDPRVTPFGAFLRRLSLDELPQFINVLQGSMSVVGPRPHAVAHNEMYRKLIKGYMMRHKVKPGITGWAQVNGLRGGTQDIAKMRERIEYDLDYLRHWSLALDLKIILKTALQFFRDQHAY